MTEFHTVKPIDNSRLVRPAAPNRVREMARLLGLGGLVAAVVLLYAWQHFACIQLRYQLESLKSQRSQASGTESGIEAGGGGSALAVADRRDRPAASWD